MLDLKIIDHKRDACGSGGVSPMQKVPSRDAENALSTLRTIYSLTVRTVKSAPRLK